MSDAEWEALRSKWIGAEGPLPDISARALRQSSRHRWTYLIFFAVLAAGTAGSLFLQSDPIMLWLGTLWSAALVIGLWWIQRTARLRKNSSPRESLAFLEGKIRIERRSAQLVRWLYPPMAVFIAVYYRNLFGDDMVVKLVARSIVLALTAVMISAPWWIRRFTDRQQAELHRWLRWMDEQQL